MHEGSTALLALLLAHVLGDFPLQTGRMVEGKAQGRPGAYAAHLGVHAVLSLGALALFAGPLLRPATAAVLAAILVGHALLDLAKSALVRRFPSRDGAALFVADQLGHVAVVLGAASLLPELRLDPAWLAGAWEAQRVRLLVEALVLATFVFPTGYLIRYLLAPLSAQLAPGDAAQEGLANAGLILGWIERALLLFAFAGGSVAAIGLVVGAKSVARFPEFRSRAFAEYFLIGTLLSVGFAGLGGVVLRAARAWL